MSAQRLWTGQFLIAITVNLFMSSVFYLLMTSMAGYAVTRFSAGDSIAGLASSGFIIGAVVGRVLAGKYLDFVGRRRMLIISMLVYAIAGFAYIPLGSLWPLIAVRIIHGVAFGAGNTALFAAVQTVIPARRRAEGSGYFGTATTLATAVGPFLAVWLSVEIGYTALFLVAGISASLAMLTACLFVPAERELSADEIAAKWSLHPKTFVDRAGVRIGWVMLLAGFAYSTVLAFIAGHTIDLGLPSAAGAFFVAYAAACLLARLTVGRIQDRHGDNIVAIPVLVCFIAGMALIGAASSQLGFIVAGVLVGLGFGCLMPTMQAVLISQTPARRLGVATSTFFLMLDIGTGIGPVVLGALVAAGGYTVMYLAAAGLVVVALVVYLIVHGRGSHRSRTVLDV